MGVPALALGMYASSARLVSLGAWALFAGSAVATIDNAFVVAACLGGHSRRSV